MQRDVESYISHKCRCVKQEVPTFQTRAPLQPITTTAPFQMVSLDFLYLEKSSGCYEYILVIMDHFARCAQAYATRISRLRQWQKSYITTAFCVLVLWRNSTMIKEKNLKIICLNNLKSCLGLDTQGLPHTIHRATGKWNVSIVPFRPCYERYRKHKSHTGKITSEKWYTPTIARDMSQQDSRYFIPYLADTLVYLSI